MPLCLLSDSIIDQHETLLPTLSPAIAHLERILVADHQQPALFIHSPNDANLITAIIKSRLSNLYTQALKADEDSERPSVQRILPKAVYVDLREMASPRHLYDRVLDTLAGWNEDSASHEVGTRLETWNGRQDGVRVVRKRKRVEEETRVEREEDDDVWSVEWNRKGPTVTMSGVQHDRRNESIDAFRQGLGEVFSLGVDDRGEAQEDEEVTRRYIVLEHAELLGELAGGAMTGTPKEIGIGATFASVMMDLDAALKPGQKITTIIVSSRAWTKERSHIGVRHPELLSFPVMQVTDITNILCARFEAASITSPSLDAQTLLSLFRALCSLVYTTFSSQIGSQIDEMAYLVAKFWPIWLNLVETKQVRSDNIAQLGGFIKNDFTREIERVANSRLPITTSTSTDAPRGFTGFIPDHPTVASSSSSSSSHPSFPITPLRKLPVDYLDVIPASPTKVIATASDQSLASSLPVIAKFLLIASFYASFNTPKSDVIHFVRRDEHIAKKGKKERKASPKKPGTMASLNAPIKAGPKGFPLERLLAIYESINDGQCAAQSIDVLMQVSSLINLKLIARTSSADRALDGVKLRCNVTRETIDMLAKTIEFKEWATYLSKPED